MRHRHSKVAFAAKRGGFFGRPELRLADAIARLKRTDEEIAASTFGEVDASRVALYRAGKTPLPSWYDITGLLRQCGLTPTDIGQNSRQITS